MPHPPTQFYTQIYILIIFYLKDTPQDEPYSTFLCLVPGISSIYPPEISWRTPVTSYYDSSFASLGKMWISQAKKIMMVKTSKLTTMIQNFYPRQEILTDLNLSIKQPELLETRLQV